MTNNLETTSYGTWNNRVDPRALTVEQTIYETLGGYADEYDIDAIAADYRAAINEALPRVSPSPVTSSSGRTTTRTPPGAPSWRRTAALTSRPSSAASTSGRSSPSTRPPTELPHTTTPGPRPGAFLWSHHEQ